MKALPGTLISEALKDLLLEQLRIMKDLDATIVTTWKLIYY